MKHGIQAVAFRVHRGVPVKALMAIVTADGLGRTLDLAHAVVAYWAEAKAAGRPPEMQAEVDDKVQQLLAHLLDYYPDAASIASSELNAVFADERDRLDADYLSGLSRSMVPVAVMREVLKKHRVLFTPSKVSNWREFSDRYGRFILTA